MEKDYYDIKALDMSLELGTMLVKYFQESTAINDLGQDTLEKKSIGLGIVLIKIVDLLGATENLTKEMVCNALVGLFDSFVTGLLKSMNELADQKEANRIRKEFFFYLQDHIVIRSMQRIIEDSAQALSNTGKH